MARSKRSRRTFTQRLRMAGTRAIGAGLLILILPRVVSQPTLQSELNAAGLLGWLFLLGGALLLALPYLMCRGLAALASRRGGLPMLAAATTRPADTGPPIAGQVPFLKRTEPPEPPPVARPGETLDQFFARLRRESGDPIDDEAVTGLGAGESLLVAPMPPVSRERPRQWGPQVFQVIEWRRFEALVEALFAQAGFITRSQSHGADGGVDIWLHSRHQGDGAPVSLVQCKHWQNKPVGVDKIRELRGVMVARDVRRGQFATASGYTAAAAEFARDNHIHLLDSGGLLGLIAKRSPAQQQALLAVALEGEYWRPTCVTCGLKMVERQAKASGRAFWGCSSYPKCRGLMQMRADK